MKKDSECPMSKYLKYRSNTLETPLLHFIIEPCLRSPIISAFFASFYSFRWHIAYPLQTRIPLPKLFLKVPIIKKLVFVTIGELFLILPFVLGTLVGVYSAFVQPSVEGSGAIAGIPIAAAFLTASRSNSVFGFLTGIPFERMLFYHILAGMLSVVLGAFHLYVAFVHPDSDSGDGIFGLGGSRDRELESSDSQFAINGLNPDFMKFSFDGDTNTSGTVLLLLLIGIFLTSMPRRFFFQLFYYLHVCLAIVVVVFSAKHEVGLVVVVAGWWVVDIFTRLIIMAGCRYPKKANMRNLPADVIELSFPKPSSFDYNAGQYIFIIIPKLSLFEAHPFSISSSPHMDMVTVHIRVLGNWTRSLRKIVDSHDEIDILMEGPYGSIAVDIFEGRYKMALLVSGGIGITPMQSICNTLIYQHNVLNKLWKKVWFVWTVREYEVFDAMNDNNNGNLPTAMKTSNQDMEHALDGEVFPARRLSNSSFTPSLITELGVSSKYLEETNSDTFLITDYYLSKKSKDSTAANNDLLTMGRPDIPKIFEKMKKLALEAGEKRVAVCVCGPHRLVEACQIASLIYSDCGVSFDFHSEKFDF